MKRYYSPYRPIGPGTFPKQDGTEIITNFDEPTYCDEIGRKAWGYIEYQQPLTPEQARQYELISPQPEKAWYPVRVLSEKHGGELRVALGSPVYSEERPADIKGENPKKEYKIRYFPTEDEARRVADVIRNLRITTVRTRKSVTQGECRVYINDKYILSFGDEIVFQEKGTDPNNYYGENIGGWRSNKPDSAFVLGLIWHPYDYIYHYSDKICSILGITQKEWIEGITENSEPGDGRNRPHRLRDDRSER